MEATLKTVRLLGSRARQEHRLNAPRYYYYLQGELKGASAHRNGCETFTRRLDGRSSRQVARAETDGERQQ